MSARDALLGLAVAGALTAAFFGGIAVERSGDGHQPPVHADDVPGKLQSYEVGWDLDRDATYRATCEADRCSWETFEYVGWTSSPGLVSYRRDLQVRRGQSVTIDTTGVRKLDAVGFGNWTR